MAEERPALSASAASAASSASSASSAGSPGAAGASAVAPVALVMGSRSDWETMSAAAEVLRELGVGCDAQVLSAHRMPDEMFRFAETAGARGVRIIIAGAGGAAHLPGMLAAKTTLPVLGVPVPSRHLQGVDSLHSIVQMPRGVPVATFAIGSAGAANAGLFAAAILALHDPLLDERLQAFRAAQHAAACAMTAQLPG